MNLSDLSPPKGQKQKKQRIGQGMGTGRGKYSGRGAKGARSISGYSIMRGFEGGQMPLHRRLPKRGFTNIFQERICHRECRAPGAAGRRRFRSGTAARTRRDQEAGRRAQSARLRATLTRKIDSAGARVFEIGSGEDPEGRRQRRSDRERIVSSSRGPEVGKR